MFFRKTIVFPILIVGLFSSCNEYQKVLKNEDVKAKYTMAEKFYEKDDFKRSKRLFEQIMPKYVGKPQGERVMFFFANTHYNTKDYYLAGYHFDRFVKSYPKSDKIQESAFLAAKSSYLISPKYSLDQTETDKALSKLQNFINSYPDSEYFDEANTMAQELTKKKEKKQIEIGKQYSKLGEQYLLDFNMAGEAALDNFIFENPGSVYREQAFFYRLKSLTNLALNSTFYRKKQRLEAAHEACESLKNSYPESKFIEEANSFDKKLMTELAQYENNKLTK